MATETIEFEQMVALRKNVAAGKLSRELVDLIQDAIDDMGPELTPSRVWENVAIVAAQRCGRYLAVRIEDSEMTETEAIEFERTIVPHGKYAGKRVRDVDPDYWITITESEFNNQLKRYLKSRRFFEIRHL